MLKLIRLTPATGEGLAQLPVALLAIQHPGAVLPGRLVAQVLGMAAGQVCHPVAVFILMEVKHSGRGLDWPSVQRRFAFARPLG